MNKYASFWHDGSIASQSLEQYVTSSLALKLVVQ